MRRTSLISALAVLATLAATPRALAATCTTTVDHLNNLTMNGDLTYADAWQCAPGIRSAFNDGYGFDSYDWNDGWGWNDQCDVTSEIHTTYNALFALHYSSLDHAFWSNDFGGNILRWGGNFAADRITDLDPVCDDTDVASYSVGSGGHVDLSHNEDQSCFYNFSVPARAAIILHEGWHRDRNHNSNDCDIGCPGEDNPCCDSNVDFQGAYTAQLAWLWWYSVSAVFTTPAMRAWARQSANAVMDTSFATHPGFIISPTPHYTNNPTSYASTQHAGELRVIARGTSGHAYARRLDVADGGGWSAWADTGVASADEYPSTVVESWPGTDENTGRRDVLRLNEVNLFRIGDNYTQALPGSYYLTHPPTAVSWGESRWDVFDIDKQGHLLHWWPSATGPEDLDGYGIVGKPAVATWGPGRIDIFARSTDDRLHWKSYDSSGGGWWGWSYRDFSGVETIVTRNPIAVSWGPGHFAVFARGADGQLLHGPTRTFAWENLGGSIAGSPAVTSWAPGRLDIFAVGSTCQVYHKSFDNGVWSQWETINSMIDDGGVCLAKDSLAALSWAPGRFDLFGKIAGTNAYVHRAWDVHHPTSDHWIPSATSWESLGSPP